MSRSAVPVRTSIGQTTACQSSCPCHSPTSQSRMSPCWRGLIYGRTCGSTDLRLKVSAVAVSLARRRGSVTTAGFWIRICSASNTLSPSTSTKLEQGYEEETRYTIFPGSFSTSRHTRRIWISMERDFPPGMNRIRGSDYSSPSTASFMNPISLSLTFKGS